MKSNKYLDTAKIVIIATALFWTPAYFVFNYYADKVSQEQIKQHYLKLKTAEEYSQSLVEKNLTLEACQYLHQMLTEGVIGVYEIKSDDVNCSEPQNFATQNLVTKNFGTIHTITNYLGTVDYKRLQFEKIELLLGQVRPQPQTLISYFNQSPEKIFWSIVVDTLLIIFVLFMYYLLYVARNLNSLKQKFQKKENQNVFLKALAKILDILNVSDFKSTEVVIDSAVDHIANLRQEQIYLNESLEYNLLHEIKKLKEPLVWPFEFFGTVARIDINEYSKLIYGGNRQYVQNMRTEFETIAAETAHRYFGFFESRNGDEVVYVFKGNFHELRATAFIRDVMRLFTSKTYDFAEQKQAQLFLKASIASSGILMLNSPSKFDFDGDALFFTNRMFGQLEHKNRNVLICFPEFYHKIKTLCQAPFEANKKITEKKTELIISYIGGFLDHKDALLMQNETLDFYTSDLDISEKLQWLRDAELKTYYPEIIRSLSGQRNSLKTFSAVQGDWIKTLYYWIENYSQEKIFTEHFASLISLGAKIFPTSDWNAECSEVVRIAAMKLQERAPSNAVETLIAVGKYDEASKLREITTDKFDNRFKGSVLIARAIANPSNKIFLDINKMIASRDQNERHSGLYAASALILHYKKHNSTSQALGFDEYHRMLELMRKLQKKDPSISARVRGFLEQALN